MTARHRGAVLVRPDAARLLLVLAHGAGAGMRHPFLEAMARRLAEREVATWRYEFPYMAAGSSRPDRPALLEETVRKAVERARTAVPDLPVIAGGKSMGGRMTSQAQARAPLPGVRGLAFLGFPLHPANEPAVTRAAHLAEVRVPMLFLQGTRDALADLELLTPIVARHSAAKLHVVDGADHGFHVLRRTGRTDQDVLAELADRIAAWGLALAGAAD